MAGECAERPSFLIGTRCVEIRDLDSMSPKDGEPATYSRRSVTLAQTGLNALNRKRCVPVSRITITNSRNVPAVEIWPLYGGDIIPRFGCEERERERERERGRDKEGAGPGRSGGSDRPDGLSA